MNATDTEIIAALRDAFPQLKNRPITPEAIRELGREKIWLETVEWSQGEMIRQREALEKIAEIAQPWLHIVRSNSSI